MKLKEKLARDYAKRLVAAKGEHDELIAQDFLAGFEKAKELAIDNLANFLIRHQESNFKDLSEFDLLFSVSQTGDKEVKA
jgi:hypothetical protein